MAFIDYICSILQNPLLLITSILTLCVIMVNGWTDAPNAIATCVSTRAITAKAAIFMAAVCNFAGVFVMTSLNSGVTMTIYNMVNFGNDSKNAVIALCAALLAIVVWSVFAWLFGIPTSESHALIAGLSGAAIALGGTSNGINTSEWVKVLYGLILSTVLGFCSGYICSKITQTICVNANRVKVNRFFKYAQIAGGASMAFMHGAQDGQKFISIFLLGISLTGDKTTDISGKIPVWLMALCSVVMALGTSFGGQKIIKAVGLDMVRLEPYQGFSADIGGALCLLFSTVSGIPVSTTHTKTTAIMGVGASRSITSVNWAVVKDMALTWVFTFPGCGALGYVTAKLFMNIFR